MYADTEPQREHQTNTWKRQDMDEPGRLTNREHLARLRLTQRKREGATGGPVGLI